MAQRQEKHWQTLGAIALAIVVVGYLLTRPSGMIADIAQAKAASATSDQTPGPAPTATAVVTPSASGQEAVEPNDESDDDGAQTLDLPVAGAPPGPPVGAQNPDIANATTLNSVGETVPVEPRNNAAGESDDDQTESNAL